MGVTIIATRVQVCKIMALYRYFQSSKGSKDSFAPDLPSPTGPLSDILSPAAIRDANEAVRSTVAVKPSKPRGISTVKLAPRIKQL